MTTERWERIAHIYQAASELPPEGRAAYLDEACAGDDALRQEVESLLAQATTSVVIDQPLWEAAVHVLDDNPAIRPGTSIGPYRIDELIGEGGMGVVYRARDTTLQRDVALKVLPALFARDPDRLARFTREAQVLAALNHPHIAAIYGVERSADPAGTPINALVLEFVEGTALADRIALGPLPLDEALPIARQIAEAVEAAHEQGIVHRDLKPANIKLRPDGTVKVLDFGLAKALDGGAAPAASASGSPVLPAEPLISSMGVLLGTAAYLSPEQARGRAADKRSDIWTFGCVLFEMLTASRAFDGKDVPGTLVAVLHDEPDWRKLPASTPAPVVRLLRRCLDRDRTRRLPAMAAVRFELDEVLTEHSANDREARRGRWADWRPRVLWLTGVALVLGGIAGSAITWRRATARATDVRVVRFIIPQPENTVLGGYLRAGGPSSQPQFAVSPDGRHVVVVASRAGVESLWLRSLDSNDIRLLAGTEGAGQPFWSPDSRSVAFFAGGKLKKLLLTGGEPITICETGEGRGGTWNRDDVIVFKSERPDTEEPRARGLQQVTAGGGEPAAATTIDDPDVRSHAWPYFLPDGRHFLYVAVSASSEWGLFVGSLGSSQATRIGSIRSAVVYGAGHLFFWKDGSIVAQAFDPDALRTTGTPFSVADRVGRGVIGDISFSVSNTGTVVSAPVIVPSMTQLTWFDRAGGRVGVAGAPARNAAFALSPDERRIVVTRDPELPGLQHLWIIDVRSGVSSQLTFGHTGAALPVWSPDGSRVAFTKSGVTNASEIFATPADGRGAEEQLLHDSGYEIPSDWSPDGRFLLFTQVNARDLDIWSCRSPESASHSPSSSPPARKTTRPSPLTDDGSRINPTSQVRTRSTWSLFPGPVASLESRAMAAERRGGGATRERSSTSDGTAVSWRRPWPSAIL